MNAGLFAAFLATAFWGLSFLLPLLLPEFSSVEVAIGRFVFYGLISTVVALIKFKGRIDCLPWKHWKLGIIFTLASLIIYYVLLVESIRFLGGAFATALASFLPIGASVYGNYRFKIYPWKVLLMPIVGIFLGLCLMHVGEVELTSEKSTLSFYLGLLCSFSAVSLWAWYTVRNGEFLRERPDVNGTDWVALMGVFALFGGLVLLALFYLFLPETLFLLKASPDELNRYLFASLANGLLVSYLTNVFWNFASRRVPMAFLGQLAVLEIFFGLLYVYIYGSTYPTFFECLGLCLIFSGLGFSFIRLPSVDSIEEV